MSRSITTLVPLPATPTGPDDGQLVARIRAGDATAARDLVQRHLRSALAVARSILEDPADAEDACQDAFAAAFAKLDRFDPAFAFRPWLLAIVRNRAIGMRRQQHVRRAEVLGSAPGEFDAPAPAADDPRVHAERAELRAHLSAAVETLTATQREVLLLHDVEGWKHAEIAAHIGCSAVTCRTTLFKARRRLRDVLASYRLADAA
jgi:RNA polymerase sigma-70 factor (ECF subfamily)